MTRRRIVPCTKHEDCTRPDGHEGACGDPLGSTVEGVASVFTGRVCPSCGWHESGRHAGAYACNICKGPMLRETFEARQRASTGITGRSSPFKSVGVYVDAEANEVAIIGVLVNGRRLVFGPLPLAPDEQ